LNSNSSNSTGWPCHAIHRHIVSSSFHRERDPVARRFRHPFQTMSRAPAAVSEA